MKFLVMTDIEGVTGVTTFKQAENTDFGKRMLMNDLHAVLDGIKDAGAEAVVYDMHTDGRNVNIEEIDVPVVMGKPILKNKWRGVGYDGFDGLFMLGLHTMHRTDGALLEHSYLREYESIHLNGILLGEIGMEAALAGQGGVPLKFVSGDNLGCEEATSHVKDVVTCAVKTSLTEDTAICISPEKTREMLKDAAIKAVKADIKPFVVKAPFEIKIKFKPCQYLVAMRTLHPEIFENADTVVMKGDNLLETWSQYLLYEKEMVLSCQ